MRVFIGLYLVIAFATLLTGCFMFFDSRRSVNDGAAEKTRLAARLMVLAIVWPVMVVPVAAYLWKTGFPETTEQSKIRERQREYENEYNKRMKKFYE